MYQSAGQYAGTSRSYANGIGTSPLVGTGAGYFARVSTAGTPGAAHLTNANRVSSGTGRFGLVLRPATATATRTGLDAAPGSLYPDPAHGRATLSNAPGQAVLSRSIALNAAGATAEFSTPGLAAGVCTRRPLAGSQTLAGRMTCYLTPEYQPLTRQ